MLEYKEFQGTLLTHELTPTGPIPTVCDPDGVYPYPSFAATSERPFLKAYRFAVMENEFLRVAICPDLGGKVHSIWDKRSGKEVLFQPESIRPVRILPRFGFIPGGIEASFPISHSPVQLERVAWETCRVDDRLYVWCGEREFHFGMQWTVEYSLAPGDAFVTQRMCLRNPTTEAHPWMSWSNAAVPARADTEFHFPNGPVLQHAADLQRIDWSHQGPRRVGDLHRMTGFFWVTPDTCAFGAFTPSLGHGLYHVADPAVTPGIKLWSYGLGPDEIWGRAGSLGGEGYLEIQGGPIRDQSIKELLLPAQTRHHVEFWIPSSAPLDIRAIPLPTPRLLPLTQVPWFDWPPRPESQFWLAVLRAHAKRLLNELPIPPGLDQNVWAPSGMEQLGEALHWAASGVTGTAREGWRFQLGTWLAARGRVDEATEILSGCREDRARALAGRLYLRINRKPGAAAQVFRTLESRAVALHPQVVIERDLALAALGPETLAERAQWFTCASNSRDEWLLERKAALLLDQGNPHQAQELLREIPFQLVHQRYTRTQLWKRIATELGIDGTTPPRSLGEDDLAHFGAYREFE